MNKPHGLKISLNGDLISRAGLNKENYVVVGSTTFIHRKDGSESHQFRLGGLDSDENKHVEWYNAHVKIGNTITMEVIDNEFDEPIGRCKFEETPEERLKNQLQHYYHLKEELKEYLKER